MIITTQCWNQVVKLHEPLVWPRTAVPTILDRDYLKDVLWPTSGQWDLGQGGIAILKTLKDVGC